MSYADFVHLHVHTDYSLLDGACKIDELLQVARSYKLPALAITDHGNLFGAIEFYKKAKKAGIKPIIGCEVYLAAGSRKDRRSVAGVPESSFHLTLLCKDMQGYKNLMKLSTIAYLEGFYYRPRVDKEVLSQHSEGLIALSGCLKGEIPFYILRGEEEKATRALHEYLEIFGKENFYLELMNLMLNENLICQTELIKLSQRFKVGVAATNDCHYIRKEDAKAHDILLCIQTGKELDDPNRMRFKTQEVYFKSPAEMETLFGDIQDALHSTVEISERCNLMLDIPASRVYLPRPILPTGFEDPHTYLTDLVKKGVEKRYGSLPEEVEARAAYELDIIAKMGYAGYFLIVKDIVDFANKNAIPVGPGRGSAVGSLVLYALGITQIDPLRYGLLFERFLNPERRTMPDIDIDFADERRDEIIRYCLQRYGEDSVTHIITFGTMAARAAVRDVGRVLKIKYGEVDRLAKLIPFGYDIARALEEVPELKRLVESDEKYSQLISVARKLEGLARHASTHAAGIVIAPGELTDFTPLYRSSNGDISTQYAMKSLEDIGILKMDFLGLRTLTVIENTAKMVAEKGETLDLDNLPLDDRATFSLLKKGETVGVFQLESPGMRDILRKLQPESFEDLIAVLSLYRPGPLGGIDKDEFIHRRHGKSSITYLHPSLKPILKETHGVILYQEQVMEIARELAGFSLGEADILRRAMGKKEASVMDEKRRSFIDGAKRKGVDEDAANQIFDLMVPFAGYGFNKSHSTGYAVISYKTAYLKAHYPSIFMAANLTSEMSNSTRVMNLISEVKRMGLKVSPPSVNHGFWEFKPNLKEIGFGLGAVKNVGQAAIDAIVEERNRGAFSSFLDFVSRVNQKAVHKRVVESLIKAGAFDCIESNRAKLLNSLEESFELISKKKWSKGQTSFFDSPSQRPESEPQDWSTGEALAKEREALGFYLSGHPLEKYKDELVSFTNCTSSQLEWIADDRELVVGGIVSKIKTTVDKTSRKMAFVLLEDFDGEMEVTVFADLYGKNQELLRKDRMLLVKGRRGARNDRISVRAETLIPLEGVREKYVDRLEVSLRILGLEESFLEKVKETLLAHPGKCSVLINLLGDKKNRMRIRSKSIRVKTDDGLLRDLRKLVGDGAVKLGGALG
ncbi:hypothetical protein AMJ40_02695 [candidate division TA06 bacterium DG_26]|uniref:DNA polymerase III subunit alpha n=1 Tax=candidate division TA06 bacterium DG_26 TaxID=1703771 RepID=A0A0S7WKB8_UNCT6|nr:MAG: hypothetical protein AMJ40_02695 [candidate division TA06 bacterium DG_26]